MFRLTAATTALNRWADLAESHALNHKEVSLDAEFLRIIFCEALGYKQRTDSPEAYQVEREFTVPGAGAGRWGIGPLLGGQAAQTRSHHRVQGYLRGPGP